MDPFSARLDIDRALPALTGNVRPILVRPAGASFQRNRRAPAHLHLMLLDDQWGRAWSVEYEVSMGLPRYSEKGVLPSEALVGTHVSLPLRIERQDE